MTFPPQQSTGATAPEPPTSPESRAATASPAATKKPGSFLRELPVLVLIAVVLALLIKTFLVQAFFIPSASMQQTLHVNDRVLVNKVVFHTRDPHRGEVVVFNTKGTGFEGAGSDFAPCPPSNAVVNGLRSAQRFLGVGACGDDDFIKRVIAVPGDTVRCCNAQGQVLVNGTPLNEAAYVYMDNREPFCAAPTGALRPAQTGASCGSSAKPVVVPAGEYWVMGDHRNDSSDSRPNGFVPRDKIVGRAFIRVWPPSRIGLLSVPRDFNALAARPVGVAATPAVAAPLLVLPLIAGRLLRRRSRSGRARRTPKA